MKILIVDSENRRQRQLKAVLASLGYKTPDVSIISRVDEIVEVDTAFDCVFVSMADPCTLKDAIETVRRRQTAIPCIAYCQNASPETVLSAIEAGAVTFLPYPFSVGDVECALMRATLHSSH